MTFLKKMEKMGRRRAASVVPYFLGEEGVSIPSDPSRILVIRTDNRLGNLVLLEPLLRSIRERFRSAELDILASDRFSELLECQGYNVIGVNKKGQIRNPADFYSLIGKLRERSYEVAIDASHPHSFSLSGAVTAILSGAGCRVSTDACDSSGWYTNTVPEPPFEWHESRALHFMGTVWEDWPAWSPPRLQTFNGSRRDAAGLHVGASGNKKYPLEYLEKLIDRICRMMILEVYWGNEEERETAEYLGSRYPVAVVPELSIAELIERIAGLRLFITPDNGPMHIASAVSVPVVALFRIDNRDRFKPLSEGSEALYVREGSDPEEAAAAVMKTLDRYRSSE